MNKHEQNISDQKALAAYNNFTNGNVNKRAGNIAKKLRDSNSCLKKMRRGNSTIGDLFDDKDWKALKDSCK